MDEAPPAQKFECKGNVKKVHSKGKQQLRYLHSLIHYYYYCCFLIYSSLMAKTQIMSLVILKIEVALHILNLKLLDDPCPVKKKTGI